MNDDDLIARYIELNPNRPGIDHARLKGFGVSVWALIGYLEQAARGDIDRVAFNYDVPVEAIKAAVAFYRRHPAVIDACITANTPGASDLLRAT